MAAIIRAVEKLFKFKPTIEINAEQEESKEVDERRRHYFNSICRDFHAFEQRLIIDKLMEHDYWQVDKSGIYSLYCRYKMMEVKRDIRVLYELTGARELREFCNEI